MYPNSHPTRHPSETLNNHYISSTYGEFIGYQNGPGIGEQLHAASAGVWNHVYAAPRDEWSTYGHSFAGSSPNVGQVIYSSPELTESCMPTAGAGGPLAPYNLPAGDHSPNHQKNSSYGWIRHSGHPSGSEGKTRTKDKYRVVYTDHQRLELEKEFQYSRYITIRRKTELSLQLSLSERQVKIWFQNRRAKERKLNRRKLQLSQEATLTRSAPPGPDPTSHPAPTSPTSTVVSDTMSAHVKEEY